MYLLIVKLVGFATTKLAKLAGALVILFLIFIAWHLLVPRATRWLNEVKVSERRWQELEDSLKVITERKRLAIDEKHSVESDKSGYQKELFALEQKFEHLKKEHENKVTSLREEIDRLDKSRTWRSWRPLRWYPPPSRLDQDIALKKGALAVLEGGGATFPDAARVEELKAQIIKVEGVLSELSAKISALDDSEFRTKRELDVVQGKAGLWRELTHVSDEFRTWILPLVTTLLFGKFAWKLFMFYAVANIAGLPRPMMLAMSPTTSLLWASPEKLAKVGLEPGDSLVCRNAWLTQHDGTRKSTILLWSFRHITVSIAARLSMCTRVTNRSDKRTTLVLGSSDPDVYITEIALEDTTEVVLQAR